MSFFRVNGSDERVETPELLTSIWLLSGATMCASFAPNGLHLAVGESEGRVVLIDLSQRERGVSVAKELDLHQEGRIGSDNHRREHISGVSWSPDGSFLAVACGNRCCIVEAESFVVVQSLPQRPARLFMTCLAWGSSLTSQFSCINQAQCLGKERRHGASSSILGRYLYLGCDDGSIQVIDMGHR